MQSRSPVPGAGALRARVFGAGPTGSLAALALVRSGWQVELRDPQPAQALLARSRAYALTHSSAELLEALELWQPLQPYLAPFRRLELCDRALHRQVAFQVADMPGRSGRAGADAVGWILQHQPLMELLLQAAERHPSIQLSLGDAKTSSDVDPVDLEVAADGH